MNQAEYLMKNYGDRGGCYPSEICPGSILLAKICQQIFFAIVAKEIIEKKLCEKITKKYRKNRKNNKSNKNQDLEKNKPRRTPKCPQISQKSQK